MSRRWSSRAQWIAGGTATAAIVAGVAVWHGTATAKLPAPIHLKVTPEMVVRGYFPKSMPPALTVPSGAVVKSDCVSSSGSAPSGPHPNEFFAPYGVTPDQILPDLVDLYFNEPSVPGAAGHILTGPIYIEGAEPGDTLEVRILDIEFRVPYGFNSASVSGGVAPGFLSQSYRKLFYIDPKRKVMLFQPGVEVPLKPFMGVMGVAPADDFVSPLEASAALGIVSSRPPGPFGGNMDHNDLGIGTSLYLPVFQPGAQFYSGDCHAVQGNGEVDGTALEHSTAPTFQFILHKGGNLQGPRAETPTHYITMGIDVELQEAARLAVLDTIDFLMAEKGFEPGDAYAFASMAVDFNIAENVDYTELVQGRIPKRFFDDWGIKPRFWHHKPVKSMSEEARVGMAGNW